jgi:hypothetical protein
MIKPKWSIELERLRDCIKILKLLRKEDALIIYDLTFENYQLIEDNKKLRKGSD